MVVDENELHIEEPLHRPDEKWLTDLDKEILRILESGLILTPSVIATNIDRPRESVSRRLSTLEAGGFVEKVERGKYRLDNDDYLWKEWEGDHLIEDDLESRIHLEAHETAEGIGEITQGKFDQMVSKEMERLMNLGMDELDAYDRANENMLIEVGYLTNDKWSVEDGESSDMDS
jgi:DNA-binding transcriptional ArsR family regulator